MFSQHHVETAPRVPLSQRLKVSPLAARIARAKGLDLSHIQGTGPDGRIVRADLVSLLARPQLVGPTEDVSALPSRDTPSSTTPHTLVKLSGMRRTIARRLTESKQQVPHIYLSVDVQMDALFALRKQLNEELASRQVKLTVNDMLIKALGLSLMAVPRCNVEFAGDTILQFARADISVAVSVADGLFTPIIRGANDKSLSNIAIEMKSLVSRARDGTLKPDEYQGGTASISNMGMMGIRQFSAVINPPQAMILAIGAAERRPCAIGDEVQLMPVMTATGSFDHRAIDGADGALLLQSFKELVERPLNLVV